MKKHLREGESLPRMVDQSALDDWFRREVLPLERSLARFVQRNWRVKEEVMDLVHDIYVLAFSGARANMPANTRQYLFTVARNHLINRAKRARIVSFDLVADLETMDRHSDLFDTERHLSAREALRRVQAGLEKLPPRVREIVWLRKVEGLNVRETAERLGIGKDAVNHQVMMGMKALTDHMLGGAGKIIRRRSAAPPKEADQ
ncbi:RNA polymerase sigma factor [Sphingosinicella microcystinivorans]|nr:RNA polymerase sigma factor [Sphingosinicella microcystinivorans]